MKTIFNMKSVDPMNQPLFLGKDLGVQRYDIIKYPVFKNLDNVHKKTKKRVVLKKEYFQAVIIWAERDHQQK